MSSSDLWDEATAAAYDDAAAHMYAPEVLDPAVDLLAGLADGGPALEFAIGTGRVALPLIDRGVPVTGIELSPAMVEVLHRKRAGVPVVVGDMATSTAAGEYALVYVVWNSIGNLRTQDEQVACFRNAARHLTPGGRFVVELGVPALRRFPPGQSAVPFHVGRRHVGFDTLDLVSQQGTSHHYSRLADGTVTYQASRFRYIWPAECDLMARLAGLEFEQRLADWHGSPFTGDSESHVSVWRRPPEAGTA
ncbi:class I SAM-dependent methyltransferase [Blastococcus sp. CCUG 61487]|uniref:class I SAM-dependent DNA methyltransferase n=1 Tax=Blastococcus sp. CCUG 61487 TaxID=1840703 RepID=UPI0010BFC529|nr:class I SAM-dependent methyltransferase [Blastococcus sp. CCUG 61487]TKJ35170.1 methyltransferase [Blastococcus sp. CCUG 61487]